MQKPETLDAIVSVVSGSDSNALANFTDVEELTLRIGSASTEVSVDVPHNPASTPPPSYPPPLRSDTEPPSSILDLASPGMRLSGSFITLLNLLFFNFLQI